MNKQLINWKCAYCEKSIASLYQKQLDANVEMHMFTQHPDKMKAPEVQK